MSIKLLVEDAQFLADNGRYLGALTTLMLAVAASSRKVFPFKKVKSRKEPTEWMRDEEAFTLFLGGRIRKILFGNFGWEETGNSGISVNFKGKQYDVAYILYKYYRCELVHEGELPEDIEFRPKSGNENLMVAREELSVTISGGDIMVLDYGWIDLLIKAVVHARCNGELFGIKHFDMLPKEGFADNDVCQSIVEKYDIRPGAFEILKIAVFHITPESVLNDEERETISKFKELLSSGVINRGLITGLRSHNLSDYQGNLSPMGLKVVQEIARAYQLVKV